MRCVFLVACRGDPRLMVDAVDARHRTPFGRAQPFRCTAVAVWDGDGPIWCQEGPRIRLAGVAARELDGSCRPSHPCPEPSGLAARNTLVRLLGGSRGTLGTGHVKVGAVRLACVSEGDGKGGGPRRGAWRRASAT